MTLSGKQTAIYGGVLVALGIAVGSYAGCRLGAIHSLSTGVVPAVSKSVEKPVGELVSTVHTEFVPDVRYRTLHDTTVRDSLVYAPVPGEWRVDTLKETIEVEKPVPYAVHDTTVKRTSTRALFLVSLNVEHDLLSGYAATGELDHNLDWLGLRNYAIYLSGGFTRGFTSHGEPRLALGLKVPLWEGP